MNQSNLDTILRSIEESIHLSGEEISDLQNWNLKLDLSVQNIINISPNEAEKSDIQLKLLK